MTAPPRPDDARSFPLSDALRGRRARRFPKGAEIPDGLLRFRSAAKSFPLEGAEKARVLQAISGVTGHHCMIPFNPSYAPAMPNYLGTAGGRTFPSSAGIHASEVFLADDEGTYQLPSRDGPLGVDPDDPDWPMDQAVKLYDGRLDLPAGEPHLEPHNHWYFNRPGSLLVIPVAYLVRRKFGPGGPLHRDTPGPWKDAPAVRGAAEVHSPEFRECVVVMAQHILERFGKFPGTFPSMWAQMYLQSHHIDLELYENTFKPGAYLGTYAQYMDEWHPGRRK